MVLKIPEVTANGLLSDQNTKSGLKQKSKRWSARVKRHAKNCYKIPSFSKYTEFDVLSKAKKSSSASHRDFANNMAKLSNDIQNTKQEMFQIDIFNFLSDRSKKEGEKETGRMRIGTSQPSSTRRPNIFYNGVNSRKSVQNIKGNTFEG